MDRQSARGTAGVLVAAALWGLWPIWVREGGGGPAVAMIAQLVGGAVALPFALLAARARAAVPRRRTILTILALGACNAANTWLYFRGLGEGAVAPAALCHYLAPVLIALVAPRLLGEPRGRHTPLALGLALAGTAALLVGGGGVDGSGAGSRTLHAALLGGGSAVFYAASTLVAKRWGGGLAGVELFAWQSLVAGALLVPVVPLPHVAAWWPAALGGVVSCALAGVAFYAGLKRLPAERVGVLAYGEVLAAVLCGWAAYGEAPGPSALLGGALVIGAGVLVLRTPSGR